MMGNLVKPAFDPSRLSTILALPTVCRSRLSTHSMLPTPAYLLLLETMFTPPLFPPHSISMTSDRISQCRNAPQWRRSIDHR